MELVIFWAIINALVGAAIGQRKNAVGACIAVSILLGPIGWIISLFIEGDVRKCPFCAETVQPAAILCPHCHRDLPKPKIVVHDPDADAKLWRAAIIVACVIVAVIVIAFVAMVYQNITRDRARADSDQQSAKITSAPAQFVRLTTDLSVFSTRGDEIKIAAGTRLQVLARYGHKITIEYKGGNYPVHADVTMPAK